MKLTEMKTNPGAPALRALEGLGIVSLEDLTGHTRSRLEELHGVGPKALGILETEMKKLRLRFADESDSGEVAAYIESFTGETLKKLREIRGIVRGAIPEAREKMAYGMPTCYYKENVVHFAGYAEHIGFYPTPSGIAQFAPELERYKTSKGAVQFPLTEALPKELIVAIIRYRMDEIAEK